MLISKTPFPDVLQPGRAAKSLYQRKRETKRLNREPHIFTVIIARKGGGKGG